MEGTNELVLCASEIEKAIETYLNEHVLRPEQAIKGNYIHDSLDSLVNRC